MEVEIVTELVTVGELSIAKLPPDPSFSCDIPQLNTSNDDRASHKLALPEVDQSKPALLAETPHPKFSIR